MAIKNLAIFDIDGTLHKTEVMSLASFRVVCAEYALPVPDMQTLYQTYGANEQTLMDLLGAPQDESYRKRFYARIDEEESRQMRLVGQCYEGVQNIEFYAAAPHLYLEDTTTDDVRRIARMLRAAGIQVGCFTAEQCLYPISRASADETLRNRSLAYYEKALAFAQELQSPLMQMISGGALLEDDPEQSRSRSMDGICRLTFICEDDGVGMTLEQLETILDKKESDAESTKIGVYNVNERLQLFFGPDAVMKYYSTPGVRTMVMLVLPIVRGKEEDSHAED